MKIPEKVRILGFEYDVIVTKGVTHGKDPDTGKRKTVHGIIRNEQTRIDLNSKSQSPPELCATFLHELIHGIAYRLNFHLGEKKVNAIANGLYAVIMDNPDLFR